MIHDPIARLCILVAVTCLAILALMGPEPATDALYPATTRCEEDMPCFDCNVHGNGLCSADDTTPFQP